MIRTRALSNVVLPTRDVDDAVAFYGEVFGFEVVVRDDERALLQTPVGDATLAIESAGEDAPLTTMSFGLLLCDPDERGTAVELALAHGGRLLEWTEHEIGGATTVVADPSGHRITL